MDSPFLKVRQCFSVLDWILFIPDTSTLDKEKNYIFFLFFFLYLLNVDIIKKLYLYEEKKIEYLGGSGIDMKWLNKEKEK